MARRTRFAWRAALLAALAGACGGDEDAAEPAPSAEPAAAADPGVEAASDGPLLEETGTLEDGDARDARGRFDRYFLDVRANDRLVVELTSDAFDPILEVTPPGSGALVNDDFEGDTSRSRLELIAPEAGQMKVEVRAWGDSGGGDYALAIRRVVSADDATPHLTVGQDAEGTLEDGDHALSGGDRFDSFVLTTTEPARVRVRGLDGAAPASTLVGPEGLTLEAHDGVYDAPRPGTYRLQVSGPVGRRYAVTVRAADGDEAPLLARAHHRFNQLVDQLMGREPSRAAAEPAAASEAAQTSEREPAATARAMPVRIGDRLHGALGPDDPQLPSGERFDVYELAVDDDERGTIAVLLESSAFDSFLRVDGPAGQHWENDDHAGTLNSRVEIPLSRAGTYRIVTTSYQAGEAGAYELKVLTQRDTQASGAPPEDAPRHEVSGALAEDDRRLRSGEYMDAYTFAWPTGARVRIEARSSDFDTYLVVQPPDGGAQRDNDDMVPGESLDAGMDLQVDRGGTWRVIVTSYQPGETGDYTLVARGADVAPQPEAAGDSSGEASGETAAADPPSGDTPTEPGSGPPSTGETPTPPDAASARVETGALAAGDDTLQSGEYVDRYTLRFTPGRAVQLRLDSSAFDTYLIVRSPSGEQIDNDDLTPGAGLNSGVDLPVAEPGDYQVLVTSYRPGETGAYTLRATEGASVVGPPPDGGGAPGQGGRVWGLFAGITDYPGQTNDLPECANDARKLAQAIRQQGNMPSEQEFLLTDAQATTDNVRQAMRTIAQRIRPDDVLVFFYSGHGGQTDTSQDARELDARDEYLLLHDGRLMDDELGQLFDGVQARVALVAIDACFAGGFGKDIITRPGRVGMFSSEEDVTSAVAGRFQAGGYLSHFLRIGIQGAADNDPQNQILTVGELTHYTWRQFGQHASDVRMSMGYQHLVVDRGAVPTTEVLWAVRR